MNFLRNVILHGKKITPVYFHAAKVLLGRELNILQACKVDQLSDFEVPFCCEDGSTKSTKSYEIGIIMYDWLKVHAIHIIDITCLSTFLKLVYYKG